MNGPTEAASHGHRITMMFHPNSYVTDLSGTERWFERVFGRMSIPSETLLASKAGERIFRIPSGYPRDYGTFTVIADVFMESIDPKRLVVDGVQRFKTVDKPHLQTLGWYVEGVNELYRTLRRHGFDVTAHSGEVAQGDEAPEPAFYSLPDQTGIRYQFWSGERVPIDPRTEPGWVLPPVSDEDPLGIERCSHHTILTAHLERALTLAVDALGGVVIHAGPDELRGMKDSTYVYLGGSILQYGVPEEGTAAYLDWISCDTPDAYHAITWKVVDLERAERHLKTQGVRIRARSDSTIVTEPATSWGVPWGFTTKPTPGDPR